MVRHLLPLALLGVCAESAQILHHQSFLQSEEGPPKKKPKLRQGAFTKFFHAQKAQISAMDQCLIVAPSFPETCNKDEDIGAFAAGEPHHGYQGAAYPCSAYR